MRDPTVALYVGCGLVMVASGWLLARVRGPRTALVGVMLQLAISAGAALAMPTYSWWYPLRPPQWVFVGSIVSAVACLAFVAGQRSKPMDRLAAWFGRHPMAARTALAVVSVVLTLGALEFIASSAVRAGLVRRYTPTETRVAEQTEDWRLTHVMSDDYREPDPVLLWRPVARSPYSSQRFRGPEITEAAPTDVTRIICYGDSNTDGPLAGGAWPEVLATLLRGDGSSRYEVLNAGVAGYSSYQGRRRFEQEAETFGPDVVLVSFGWNDAANAISAEDKAFAATNEFRAASPTAVLVRRWLLRYDAVLVAARLLAAPSAVPQGDAAPTYGPRVTLSDYEVNLRAMVTQGRAGGTRIVIMTRPHLAPEAELARAPGWRRRVPAYNAVARRVAAERDVTIVDAQRIFAATPELFVDESHLNSDGHRRLAEAVLDVLHETGIVR